MRAAGVVCVVALWVGVMGGCEGGEPVVTLPQMRERAEEIGRWLVSAADVATRTRGDLAESYPISVDDSSPESYWYWSGSIELADNSTVSPAQVGEAMMSMLTDAGWAQDNSQDPLTRAETFRKQDLGGWWVLEVYRTTEPPPRVQNVTVAVASPVSRG